MRRSVDKVRHSADRIDAISVPTSVTQVYFTVELFVGAGYALIADVRDVLRAIVATVKSDPAVGPISD